MNEENGHRCDHVHSDDDLIAKLQDAVGMTPSPEHTATMAEACQETIRQALDSRGDTFGQHDIIVLRNAETGKEVRIPCAELPSVIGGSRTPPQADVTVAGNGVSGRHCLIERVGTFVRIRDWPSKNGTFLNGDQIEESFLCEGDTVGIGDAELTVSRA
jgi:pSer/pThr/pTyr-binding forkhead associated (FHA) protein